MDIGDLSIERTSDSEKNHGYVKSGEAFTIEDD